MDHSWSALCWCSVNHYVVDPSLWGQRHSVKEPITLESVQHSLHRMSNLLHGCAHDDHDDDDDDDHSHSCHSGRLSSLCHSHRFRLQQQELACLGHWWALLVGHSVVWCAYRASCHWQTALSEPSQLSVPKDASVSLLCFLSWCNILYFLFPSR